MLTRSWNPGNICWWNQESYSLKPGIQVQESRILLFGIQNPGLGIWNLTVWNLESGSRNLGLGIQVQESRILLFRIKSPDLGIQNSISKNPASYFQESRILLLGIQNPTFRNPEFTFRNPESGLGIQVYSNTESYSMES